MNHLKIKQDSFIRKLQCLGLLQEGVAGLLLPEAGERPQYCDYVVRWHSKGVYMHFDGVGEWKRVFSLETIKHKLKVIMIKS